MEEIPKVSNTFKLVQDLAKLVNNPIGSDVQFLVGGNSTVKEGDSASKQSQSNRVATFYGHSSILCVRSKYFAAIFDNDKQWMETSSGIFRKPNISPAAFHILLRYIYTSNMDVVDKFLLPELIAASEEMDLAELSVHCQHKLMAELKESITSNDRNTAGAESENGQTFPFNLAIRNLLIPGLILSYEHNTAQLFDELLQFTFENIDIILATKDTLGAFLDNLPLAIFKHILSSNSLALEEYDVWQLVLNWTCHQTKILKATLETQLRSNFFSDDQDDDGIEPTTSNIDNQSTLADKPLISDEKLQEIKAKLTSLISMIRFTLMKPEEYARDAEYFQFFLPGRRLVQLQQFFSIPNSIPQDLPRCKPNIKRKEVPIPIPDSKIADAEAGLQLRKWIHESRGISGCTSSETLKFKLLFRATDNGFAAFNFHQRCDNQGPTLLLVRSSDGHLFGGVNFSSWTCQNNFSIATANFLFALKDKQYRSQPMKFDNITGDNSAGNYSGFGPIFGAGNDLRICHDANINQSSYSDMPRSYGGTGASNTSFAGVRSFTVSDYEVYAIS